MPEEQGRIVGQCGAYDPFARHSDDELLRREQEMHLRAWDAPKSLEGSMNDAHARWGNEWCQLYREVKRRGLTSLPMPARPDRNDQ